MNIPPFTPDEFTGPIAVITGGWSQERDRSLLSGRTVNDALTGMGIKTAVIDLDGPRDALLSGLGHVESAFLAIAGRGAEDGGLQGLLETLGIPYTGSGVLASALGMHKLRAKEVVSEAAVLVPRSDRVNVGASPELEAERLEARLGLPLILKPIAEGGSIGLQVATSAESLISAIAGAGGNLLMAERFRTGRSVSVGVLEDVDGTVHALPALEAQTPNGIYSYAAKRGNADCDYHCPARLSDTTADELRRQALAAHRVLGCVSHSRHDFIVSDDGRAWWLEVNTLPGLSRSGNLARMAQADGLTYEQLILHILRGARVDRRAHV
ncbi:D-alanine--D-alanine ligase [Streptomyces sp. NPDC056296]|uniref:D-alanine--D-alanine ligase family protein n=1 Tax=Streptomyces sp. NPDC056296 TaxID=3345775 RepID=UPI0035DA95E2